MEGIAERNLQYGEINKKMYLIGLYSDDKSTPNYVYESA